MHNAPVVVIGVAYMWVLIMVRSIIIIRTKVRLCISIPLRLPRSGNIVPMNSEIWTMAPDGVTGISTLLVVVHAQSMPELMDNITQVIHIVAPAQVHLTCASRTWPTQPCHITAAAVQKSNFDAWCRSG